MISKTTVIALLAITLVTTVGVAYATFSSSVTITGTAAAGNEVLYFFSDSTTTGTYATCTWTGSTGVGHNSLTLTVSNLSPGDSCAASATIADSGTLPATSEASSIGGTGLCATLSQTDCIQVSDNLGINTAGGALTGSGSTTIPANSGGSFTYTVTVSMPAGSTLQSTSGSFTITVTGSVGS